MVNIDLNEIHESSEEHNVCVCDLLFILQKNIFHSEH
jgi:hypothetical protein